LAIVLGEGEKKKRRGGRIACTIRKKKKKREFPVAYHVPAILQYAMLHSREGKKKEREKKEEKKER